VGGGLTNISGKSYPPHGKTFLGILAPYGGIINIS